TLLVGWAGLLFGLPGAPTRMLRRRRRRAERVRNTGVAGVLQVIVGTESSFHGGDARYARGYDEETIRFVLCRRFVSRVLRHGVRRAEEEDFVLHQVERFRALRHFMEGRTAELRRESAVAARRKERLGVHV